MTKQMKASTSGQVAKVETSNGIDILIENEPTITSQGGRAVLRRRAQLPKLLDEFGHFRDLKIEAQR